MINNSNIDPDDIFIDNIHLFFGKTYKLNLVKETFDIEGYYLEDTLKFKTLKTEEEKENYLLEIGNNILEDVFKNINEKIKLDLEMEEKEKIKITETLKSIFFDDIKINDIIKEHNPDRFYSAFFINYFEEKYKFGEVGKIFFNEENYKETLKNNFGEIINTKLFDKISIDTIEKMISIIKPNDSLNLTENNSSSVNNIDIFKKQNIYDLKYNNNDDTENTYYSKLYTLFNILYLKFSQYKKHEDAINTNIDEELKPYQQQYQELNKVLYVNSIFIYIYSFLVSDTMNSMLSKIKYIDIFLDENEFKRNLEHIQNFKNINENLLRLINIGLNANVNINLNELYKKHIDIDIDNIKKTIYKSFNISYIDYDINNVKTFYEQIKVNLKNECIQNVDNYKNIVTIFNIVSFLLNYLKINDNYKYNQPDHNTATDDLLNNKLSDMLDTSTENKKIYVHKIIDKNIINNSRIKDCFTKSVTSSSGGGISLDSLKAEIRMKISAINPKLYY